MKKIRYSIFSIIVMFSFNLVLKADCTCSYDASFFDSVLGTYSETGSFTISQDDDKINIDGFKFILDSHFDNNYSEKSTIEALDGGCPDYIYVCEHFASYSKFVVDGITSVNQYSIIINGDLINNFTNDISLKDSSMAVYTSTAKKEDCVIAAANEEKTTCEIKEGLFGCALYDDKYKLLKEYYCDLNSDNCSSSKISEYNKQKEELSTWCSAILKYADYVNPCASACLNLNKDINEIEKSSTNTGECGISGRLIIWIANIVRWLKYIIPVAVIVLGILDFMKAMGADKEDEMKKAQQRFIRRLIATALIFIIPFILEFVLNKMGFDANGCGIVNL